MEPICQNVWPNGALSDPRIEGFPEFDGDRTRTHGPGIGAFVVPSSTPPSAE